MHSLMFLAVAAVLAVASPAVAQVPQPIPPADQWRDVPALAPAMTDPDTRARMNAEIVQAIVAANGDQEAARAAITAIAARYQELALPQGARTRPGPK